MVPPRLIGTAAAIVNGIMFLTSGLLIAIPAEIAGKEIAEGASVSILLVKQATNPLILGLIIALVLSLLMRETYTVAGLTK